MKSAYEMALARMGLHGGDSPRALTDAQRAELSNIDRRYSAKIAEREIILRAAIDEAHGLGDAEQAEKLSEQLRRERAGFDEERELAKERIRKDAV
jgi:hypothetical protein